MKKALIVFIVICIVAAIAYFLMNGKSGTSKTKSSTLKTESSHHLNIPENGIQSMMEANSQKVIEGTDGSVIILIGSITRRKVDITIKRDDRILDERLIAEDDNIHFDYEGNNYTVELHNIKKPLIGIGKAEISIK